MAQDNRPLIVKRKKVVGGGGHHGGAWKVAYADFVTAMMAFFLLMWLLNATSEEVKSGIANYFESRIPISRNSSGGDGAFTGNAFRPNEGELAESGGGRAQIKDGRAAGDGELDFDPQGAAPPPAPKRTLKTPEGLKQLQDALESLSGESDAADALLRHIRTRVTEEGLVIELFEREGAPLFAEGSAEPSPELDALVDMVASVATLVTNGVAVTGHTGGGESADGDWTLSSNRAQATRRLLTKAGVGAGRIASVSGRAATEPMIADDPADPRNRRVEITLLRSDL
jgi:chemotaxis protein MotB